MKPRLRFSVFLVAGLALALALAVLVSPQASGEPDGLNKVAIDNGFASNEQPHALEDVPTAGYQVKGVDDERISTGIAGLVGVVVTFSVCGALFLVVRRTRSSAGQPVAGRSIT